MKVLAKNLFIAFMLSVKIASSRDAAGRNPAGPAPDGADEVGTVT